MDTQHVELPVSRAEAVRRSVEQVVAGGDAVLCVSFDAAAVLDDIADLLIEHRWQVLHCAASGQGGLSLSGLLAQITGRPDLGGHDDEVLQRGFQTLTTPGEGCSGVVLLIDGAGALQRSALRYLQFVARTAGGPRFVLASEEGLPDLLDADLALLRTRLAAAPVLAVAGWAGSDMFMPGTASAAASIVGPVPLPVAALQVVPPDPALPTVKFDAVPFPGMSSMVVPPQPPALPGRGLDGPPLPGFVLPVIGPHVVSDALSVPAATPEPALPLGTVLAAVAPLVSAQPLAAAASLTGAGDASGVMNAGFPEPRRKSGGRAVAAWAGIGAAMAACVAFGVALGRYDFVGEPAAAPQAASVALAPAGDAGPGAPDPASGAAPASNAPPAVAAAPPQAPAPAEAVAPQVAAPPPGSTAPGQANASVTDDPARRPAASHKAVAVPADTPPARARAAQMRDAESRFRETQAAGRDGAAPRPRRAAQAADGREHRAAEDGRQASYALPVQPAYSAPYGGGTGGGTGERRPIIGTFSTDQNGVRTFRFAE